MQLQKSGTIHFHIMFQFKVKPCGRLRENNQAFEQICGSVLRFTDWIMDLFFLSLKLLYWCTSCPVHRMYFFYLGFFSELWFIFFTTFFFTVSISVSFYFFYDSVKLQKCNGSKMLCFYVVQEWLSFARQENRYCL